MTDEEKEKKKFMTVYLPNVVVSRLKTHVKKTCGNLSWFMEKMITEYLDEIEK